jgi:hypothetical protein
MASISETQNDEFESDVSRRECRLQQRPFTRLNALDEFGETVLPLVKILGGFHLCHKP